MLRTHKSKKSSKYRSLKKWADFYSQRKKRRRIGYYDTPSFFVSDSPFFRDRVFGWRVCPPRRYVRFACNARIVMSQDPADARIGGDKWSDRSVEKARLGSEFYTGSIEDTRCTTRGLRKAVQWRGLTSLTNGRHIVRQAGIQNPGFRKMHSRSGRFW